MDYISHVVSKLMSEHNMSESLVTDLLMSAEVAFRSDESNRIRFLIADARRRGADVSGYENRHVRVAR